MHPMTDKRARLDWIGTEIDKGRERREIYNEIESHYSNKKLIATEIGMYPTPSSAAENAKIRFAVAGSLFLAGLFLALTGGALSFGSGASGPRLQWLLLPALLFYYGIMLFQRLRAPFVVATIFSGLVGAMIGAVQIRMVLSAFYETYIQALPIVGTLLSCSAATLGYILKIKAFPHWGFFGAKKSTNGEFPL